MAGVYDVVRELVRKIPWHDEFDLLRHLEAVNVAEFGEEGRYPVAIPPKAAPAPDAVTVEGVADVVLQRVRGLLEEAGLLRAPAPAVPDPAPVAPEPVVPAPAVPPAAAEAPAAAAIAPAGEGAGAAVPPAVPGPSGDPFAAPPPAS